MFMRIQYSTQVAPGNRPQQKASLAGGRGAASPLHPLLFGNLLGRPRSDPSQTKTQSTSQDSRRHVSERVGMLGFDLLPLGLPRLE
jgi:hypothetical protein